ncbi:MAG: (Fe-S)-binding protein [Bacteroidota bacterium]
MKRKSAFLVGTWSSAGTDIPSYDFILSCMHCGLCLPTCPTYLLTGDERSSPRGRIRLMKAVAEGQLLITDAFAREMYFCLDCRACETACPAGVHYGALVEAARVQIERAGYGGMRRRLLKRISLDWLFRSRNRFHAAARIVYWYNTLGLRLFVAKTKIAKTLFPKLSKIQSLIPHIGKKFFSATAPEVLRPASKPRYRVAILTGCIMDVAFPDVNQDTVEVLLRNDCEVVIPKAQECCGSVHAHNGDVETARLLARRNIDAFLKSNIDYLVVNAAGCSAFMKEYGRLLHDDPSYAEKARILSAKVRDITEFLIEIGFKKPTHEIQRRVTYHEPCHLVHAQRISAQPREIIRSIPGVEFVELPESSWCCGSAGIYNIIHYEESMKLLDRKMENVRKTDADILVTSNPGCHIQLEHGLRRTAQTEEAGQQRRRVELLHIVTLLRRAYEGDQNQSG